MLRNWDFVALSLFACIGCMPPSGGGSGSARNDDGGASFDARTDGSMGPRMRDSGRPIVDATLSDIGWVRDGDLPDFQPPSPDGGSQAPDAAQAPICEDQLPRGQAESGFLEPASLMTDLELPSSPGVANEWGCDVVGANRGSGLASWVNLLMANPQNVRRNRNRPEIDFIHIFNWGPGDALSDRQPVVGLHQGLERNGRVESIARVSAIEAVNFRCPTLTGELSDPLPLLPDTDSNPLAFVLEFGRLRMDITPNARGFDSTGLISGYLTIGGMIEAVEDFQGRCASDEAPFICDDLAALFSGDPETIVRTTLLQFMSGADALLDFNGEASDNCGSDCNAVSVCLRLRGTPILMHVAN